VSILVGMAFLHEEENDHNTTDERKEYGAEHRYSLEPQKAHLTGEFVIMAAKFGDHALRCCCCFLGQETLLPLPQPPSC